MKSIQNLLPPTDANVQSLLAQPTTIEQVLADKLPWAPWHSTAFAGYGKTPPLKALQTLALIAKELEATRKANKGLFG